MPITPHTAYILVKNLDSEHGVDDLHGPGFTLTRFKQGSHRGHELRKRAERLFPAESVQFSDWLYQKHYEHLPASTDQDVGYGDIPVESEDLLLAFRLLKPGDIAFAAQTIEEPDGKLGFQHRYRYFNAISSRHSYVLTQHELAGIGACLELVRSPKGRIHWFRTARRFFLYGGAKEFNPYPHIRELDRIVDYMIALEAVLTDGAGETGSVFRKRAAGLLNLTKSDAKDVGSLLGEFYGWRSAITHGKEFGIDDPEELREKMWRFETLVRKILLIGLKTIPASPTSRGVFLNELGSVSDADRMNRIKHQVAEISNPQVRAALLNSLAALGDPN